MWSGSLLSRRHRGTFPKHVGAVRVRSREALDYALSTNRLATRFFGRLNLAEFIGLGAILILGYWLVDTDRVSVGATAAVALYFHRLFDPINTLLDLFGTAQEAAAGLARLIGITQVPQPDTSEPGRPRDTSVRIAHVVDFAYGAGHPVLRDVDLTIAADEHVALVGASGAGKTTLAKLVAGIHRPTGVRSASAAYPSRTSTPTDSAGRWR